MVLRTLHLMHFSSQSQDSEAQFNADMNKLIAHRPEIMSLTELSNNPRKNAARVFARNHGYRGVTSPGTAADSGFLVRNDLKIRDQGTVYAGRGKRQRGDWKNEYLTWVKVDWLGETIYFHCLHWSLTGGLPMNIPVVNQQTRTMVTQMRKHAPGAYCFYSGDMNEDDDPRGNTRTQLNRIMAEGGIASMWDENHVYPGTMGLRGRTLDVIGRDMKNKDMKNTRYKVHRGIGTFSDHLAVSAWYQVNVAGTPPRTTPGGSGIGTPVHQGPNPDDEDIYATGGNVSWKDYRDPTIYKLNQAVDDSDLFNG